MKSVPASCDATRGAAGGGADIKSRLWRRKQRDEIVDAVLADVGRGAGRTRPESGPLVAGCREQHDGHVGRRRVVAEKPAELHPRQPCHDEIGDHHVGRIRDGSLERTLCIRSLFYLVPLRT